MSESTAKKVSKGQEYVQLRIFDLLSSKAKADRLDTETNTAAGQQTAKCHFENNKVGKQEKTHDEPN